MSCIAFEELLSAYLDQELNAQEESAVREHLPSCRACQEALSDLKETQSLVQSLKRLSVPATLWPAVQLQTTGALRVVPFFLVALRRFELMMLTVAHDHQFIFARASRGIAALAASLAVLVGLITLLGYVAPEPISTRESNMYLGGHAYHLMRQPLADHSSWSYVAGESNFELISAEE